MCQYQTLYHHTEKGYAICCLQCGNIQLGFGNIAITFFKDEFYRFQRCMNALYQDVPENETASSLKNITVPTPCEGMILLLSPKELYQLNLMLDKAETELRSQELIGLFGNH